MSITRRTALQSTLTMVGASVIPSWAKSEWPDKTIRFVVPFAPGGTSEIVARSVSAELSKQLGQPIYIENKGGGGGVPAFQNVAKAAPDGYTLILGNVGNLAVNPYIFPDSGYDINKDFAPVTLLAKVPNLFVIHPDVPARNLVEFVAYVKKHPGDFSFGTAGNASAGHLAMEYLKLATGMFITHIPYRGTGPMLTDLIAGRVQASSAGLPALGSFIKSGQLRAIAVGTSQRIPALPNVPTVAESGPALGLGKSLEHFETSQWYGMLVPAGTPKEIIKRLQEESLKALKSKSVTDLFAREDTLIGGDSPEEFGKFITSEQKIWKDIVTKAHIKPN